MQVILCGTNKAAGPTASLDRLIRGIVPAECFHFYPKIRDLAERLRDPRQTTDIAVLVPGDERELNKFTVLRGLSDDIRILLVLPVCSPILILKGHILRPRFLTFADADLEEVGGVLEKMMHSRAIMAFRNVSGKHQ